MRKLFLFLLLPVSLHAAHIGFVVGSADTTYGTLHSNYTTQIDFLIEDYGATVTTLYDTATFNTSAYDVLVISEAALAANVAELADSAVPIFVIDRYMYDTFRLATGQVRPIVSAPATSYRVSSTNWISATMMDNIGLQLDNNALFGYTGLADGVDPIYNFTAWQTTSDTVMSGVADSGATLTSGTAPERRAFCGGFYNDVANMTWCHAWRLYGRILAWLDHDTTLASNPWLGEVCFAGSDEIQACWTELGARDSAIYVTQTRWGYDYQVMLTFEKINNEAIARKTPSGSSCDSIVPLHIVAKADVNNVAGDVPPVDTGFAFRIAAFEIISHWWRCPNCGGGGFPRDSVWVNRYDAVGGGSKAPWDSKDLTSGIDYAATYLDTFKCTIETQAIGDTMNLALPGSIYDEWVTDTSANYGWVLFPDIVYATCDSCDAEIETDDCYNNQTNLRDLRFRVYFSESGGEPEPTAKKNSIGGGVKIGSGVKF